MTADIQRYPNLESLSQAAATFVVELASSCVQERGIFTLVLSGGTSPRLLYEQLAQPALAGSMPWEKTHLFWGDERCVPPDHQESNFALAFQTLITRVPVPAANIHRMPAEITPIEAAAREYEEALRVFSQNLSQVATPAEYPSFDLILLGLGKDGHTASLFPGHQVLEERVRWVAAVRASSASPPVPRLTLTLPAINNARCVLFLISGVGKRHVIEMILTDPERAAQDYPAARVRPAGQMLWFVDEGGMS